MFSRVSGLKTNLSYMGKPQCFWFCLFVCFCFKRAAAFGVPRPPLQRREAVTLKVWWTSSPTFSLNADPVGVLHMHELMIQEVENAWLPLAAQ